MLQGKVNSLVCSPVAKQSENNLFQLKPYGKQSLLVIDINSYITYGIVKKYTPRHENWNASFNSASIV